MQLDGCRDVSELIRLIFSGTTERVCLVTGPVEAIMAVLTFIMEKIKEKPDLVPKPSPSSDLESKLSADRSKQVSGRNKK